jgi:hypothetical protein
VFSPFFSAIIWAIFSQQLFNMPRDLDQIYQTIARHITADKGQCVLILGPELAVNKEGVAYKVAMHNMLPEGSKSKYLEPDNLFYFHDPFDAEKVLPKVIDFYNEAGDQALLRLISRIKFPLIINVCSDKALNSKYTDLRIKFEEGYFTKDSKLEFNNLPFPSKKLPVIYNIFGSVELDNSIILTHNKLYETIQYLLPENTMPDQIELFLRGTAKSYVFLGFKFDSWYYQLICHKLKIKTSLTDSKTSLSTPYFEGNDSVSIIMEGSFDMAFTAEYPAQCLENIIKACEVTKPGDLRDPRGNLQYSIFVSYAWNDNLNQQREMIVDFVQEDLTADKGSYYQFLRDKSQLHQGNSIDSFMNRIGSGKAVVVVISDKYLRSVYCMTEASRIFRGKEKSKRIFVVVLEDPTEDLLAKRDEYKAYWLKLCQEILADPARMESGRFDNYLEILRFVEDFFIKIADKIHMTVKYEKLADARTLPAYIDLITTLQQKLKET